MSAIIQTTGLSKSFGAFTAVNDLSLRVEQGEIYGFLGLNGAGKSTTIRMLLGMIKPSRGSIQLFDRQLTESKKDWNNVGYMVEASANYPNLSVRDNLKIFAKYRALDEKLAVDRIMDELQLTRYQDVKSANLSMGNKQRLGIAKAMMHRPRLLILDEPINGLDPAGIVEVRELLLDLARRGTTIFISSHILSEIARTATRIGIIHHGCMIKEMTTADLRKNLQQKIVLDTTNNPATIKYLTNVFTKVDEREGVISIYQAEEIDTLDVSARIVAKGTGIRELYRDVEDLEHYFLRLINEKNIE